MARSVVPGAEDDGREAASRTSWQKSVVRGNYAFPKRERSVFNDLSLRIGVNNVFDAEPPIADADTGYQRGAGTNPRGRVFYAQATKRF